jgi:hypothetical protein
MTPVRRFAKAADDRRAASAHGAAFALAMAWAVALTVPFALAQAVDAPAPQPPPVKERYLISRFPDKPSLPPAVTIPIDPLGFTAPGAIYLGARNALVTLDFIDENRLLFTFRVPGLLHREAGNNSETDEREIRAVVLTLPKGAIEAESSWTVHDRVRYLWMLANGHFLLRDRNGLSEGDATLALKPYLDFPGSLLWLELDPSQQLLVTNSREPVPAPQKSAATTAPSQPGASSTPATGNASDQDSSDAGGVPPEFVLRILQRKSGHVMLVSRVRAAIHVPINSLGYLENLRGKGSQWTLDMNYFAGGTKILGSVDSVCEPDDTFLSEQEIFVTACGPQGESKLVAMTTSGRTLWVAGAPTTEIWPQLTVAANGSRLAWATLDATHSINSYSPMDAEDIREQSVTVFNAADGNIALVSPLSPIFDAGGNVAISPSGRRVALINSGGIQVFDLPDPPSLPAPTHH